MENSHIIAPGRRGEPDITPALVHFVTCRLHLFGQIIHIERSLEDVFLGGFKLNELLKFLTLELVVVDLQLSQILRKVMACFEMGSVIEVLEVRYLLRRQSQPIKAIGQIDIHLLRIFRATNHD